MHNRTRLRTFTALHVSRWTRPQLHQAQSFSMTTYSDSASLMNQVDAEMGYSKRSLLKQELSVVADDDIAGADLRAMHGKGDTSLILAIVSFIFCFFCTLGVYGASMICHIPAMLFAAKSRVSAEKKDYYESKLMLHWSYICTFAGCFIGWVIFAAIVIFSLATIIIVLSAK